MSFSGWPRSPSSQEYIYTGGHASSGFGSRVKLHYRIAEARLYHLPCPPARVNQTGVRSVLLDTTPAPDWTAGARGAGHPRPVLKSHSIKGDLVDVTQIGIPKVPKFTGREERLSPIIPFTRRRKKAIDRGVSSWGKLTTAMCYVRQRRAAVSSAC